MKQGTKTLIQDKCMGELSQLISIMPNTLFLFLYILAYSAVILKSPSDQGRQVHLSLGKI